MGTPPEQEPTIGAGSPWAPPGSARPNPPPERQQDQPDRPQDRPQPGPPHTPLPYGPPDGPAVWPPVPHGQTGAFARPDGSAAFTAPWAFGPSGAPGPTGTSSWAPPPMRWPASGTPTGTPVSAPPPGWGAAPGVGGPAGPGWGAPGPGWRGAPFAPRPRKPFPWRAVGLVAAILAVIALVVIGLLAFVVGPRFARVDVLDAQAVAQGVTRVVTEDWHRTITDVSCPEDQEIRPGATFTCSATVDGRPTQVPVSVVDPSGTYSVGQPR